MPLAQGKFKIERGVPVDASKVIPNPWNPNMTNEQQQRAIGESLGFYGQVQELLVREHPEKPGYYELLDGEHRLQELEQTVYVNVIHGLSDAEAKKLTIVMDGTKGEFDKVDLAKLLSDIQADMGDETGLALPYSPEELDEIIKLAAVNWDEFGGDANADEKVPDADGQKDQWQTLKEIKLPVSAMERVQDAYNLIEQSRGGLPKEPGLAWGVVLESLAADFLAGAGVPPE